jgi:hypothetical protein
MLADKTKKHAVPAYQPSLGLDQVCMSLERFSEPVKKQKVKRQGVVTPAGKR